MFIFGNLFYALSQVLEVVITVYWWLIIFRAVTSWVNPDPSNTIVLFLVRVTEPILAPFRRLIPAERFGIDLSPIFAILVLLFLRYFLVQTLYTLALRFQ